MSFHPCLCVCLCHLCVCPFEFMQDVVSVNFAKVLRRMEAASKSELKAWIANNVNVKMQAKLDGYSLHMAVDILTSVDADVPQPLLDALQTARLLPAPFFDPDIPLNINGSRLRPNQRAVYVQMEEKWKNGAQKLLLSAATGSGKTGVLVAAPFAARAKRCLILTPSADNLIDGASFSPRQMPVRLVLQALLRL